MSGYELGEDGVLYFAGMVGQKSAVVPLGEVETRPPVPAGRTAVTRPPVGDLWLSIVWDTWWPEHFEVRAFEDVDQAKADASHLDPGCMGVVVPVTKEQIIATYHNEIPNPYEGGDD